MSTTAPAPRRKPFPLHIVVFVAPGALIYTIFMICPLLNSLRAGFYAPATGGAVFVGFDNFARLVTEPLWIDRFRGALRNSFIFFAVNFLVQNPVALLLATLLADKTRASGLYRAAIFAPAVLSLVIVAFVWQLLLSPLWGVAKDALGFVGLANLYQPWLGLPGTSLITLALISAWQYIGVPMMLYYAALISIPYDLTEAAVIDGAGSWRIFWSVKLPLLLPIVGVVSLLTYIANISAFDVIFAVKGPLAGPNFASDTLMTLFYRTFFGFEFQQPDPAMGGAIAAATFMILMVGVAAYFFLWQRRVTSYEL